MRKSIVFFGIILIAFIVSCTTIRHKRSFGIRHDKTIMDYELVATNKAPFDSDNYPDFSSVISFVYSLDGSDHQDYVATGVLVVPKGYIRQFLIPFYKNPQDDSGITDKSER